jgi:hypothetical protein
LKEDHLISFRGISVVRTKYRTAIAKSLKLLLMAVIFMVSAVPVLAEDRMVLGPRQFEADTSGAVLCVWSIYLTIQAAIVACGIPRQSSDDAIDKDITEMDEFILANSSLRPTRTMLDDFKRRTAEREMSILRQQGLQKFCDGSDIKHFRNLSPDYIQTEIRKLLAVPREPVMNPCL